MVFVISVRYLQCWWRSFCSMQLVPITILCFWRGSCVCFWGKNLNSSWKNLGGMCVGKWLLLVFVGNILLQNVIIRNSLCDHTRMSIVFSYFDEQRNKPFFFLSALWRKAPHWIQKLFRTSLNKWGDVTNTRPRELHFEFSQARHRWVALNPNTLNPNSRFIRKNRGAYVFLSFLYLRLNLKFAWTKSFLLGFVCSVKRDPPVFSHVPLMQLISCAYSEHFSGFFLSTAKFKVNPSIQNQRETQVWVFVATVGSFSGLHCGTIILLMLLASSWTMEAIVCPAKSSKLSRKSLCNTSWEMLWKVTETIPAYGSINTACCMPCFKVGWPCWRLPISLQWWDLRRLHSGHNPDIVSAHLGARFLHRKFGTLVFSRGKFVFLSERLPLLLDHISCSRISSGCCFILNKLCLFLPSTRMRSWWHKCTTGSYWALGTLSLCWSVQPEWMTW